MPVTQKQKATRGIPRKARNPVRKQKHQRYWDRATCTKCALTFRSPKAKMRHVESGHMLRAALRQAHVGVQQKAMDAIQERLKGVVFG